MLKKIATVTVSTLLLASSAYAQVVATYSGKDITSDQVMEKFRPMLDMQPEIKGKKFSELEKELQNELVNRYVHYRLIDDEASKKGILNRADVQEKLKLVEQQIVHQVFIEEYLEKNVTDKMITAEYEKLKKELAGKKEIKTSHILVDSAEKANEIKKKLDKGESFEAMAKKHSADKGSAAKGGQIGYTVRGQLVPEYETAANSLGKGKISDPVKSQFGWHIIRLEDKRDIKVPTKKEAAAGLRQKLRSEILPEYIASLEKKAKVEYKGR